MEPGQALSKPMEGGKEVSTNATATAVPARVGWAGRWPIWAPYAAVLWSLVYAALGLYWAVSGRGFPYADGLLDTTSGPIVGRLGPVVAWIIVIASGLPAAVVGVLMLRGVRRLRPVIITVGAVLAAILLLLTSDIGLLTMLAYIPYILFRLITGADISTYTHGLKESQWIIAHQLWCLLGGFAWLAATISYARRSSDACLYCGRTDRSEGWNSPRQAASWGRIAVYVAIAIPVIYAITRYAWALGIPLGMSQEAWRAGQVKGLWVSGLFLANVGLVGAVLMLGLVQRWGEVFPRWMIGLAGRRVPIALALVPAALMSVLFIVGGISIISSAAQVAGLQAISAQELWITVGPVLLFPVWGAALAIGSLGYYYRRRGPCAVCARGAPG